MNTRRLMLMIVLGLWLAMSSVSPTWADDDLKINDMYVSVWPEYDTPQVLVQYEGRFADPQVFPRRVSFLVPPGALIDATCALDASGKHTKIPFEEQPEADGWTRLSYNLTTPTFHLDFYYNPIQGEATRNIAFRFRPTYPAAKLLIEVQEPQRASGFRLTPAAQSVNQDNQGFKYHRSSFTNVDPGKPIDVRIAYTKPDSRPSVTTEQPATTVQQARPIQWLPDMPLLLATLAGAGGMMLFALWYTTQRAHISPPHLALVEPSVRRTTSPTLRGGYCTQCGCPLQAEDRFCPECGERRYRPDEEE